MDKPDPGPGVFRLYEEEGGEVHYVGRSDTNLRKCIKNLKWKCPSCGKEVSFVECYNCESDEAAFKYECIEFHTYSGLCNKEHPEAPDGKNLTCRKCLAAS